MSSVPSASPQAAAAATPFTSVIRSELFAMRYDSDLSARRAPASLGGVQAGPVDVLRYVGGGEHWGGRDTRLIERDHADYHVVSIPLSGCLSVTQNGWSADLEPGRFTIVSTTRPFSARIRPAAHRSEFAALHVRVPGALLRRRLPQLDDHCGRELAMLPGSPRLMLSLFEVLLAQGPFLPAERIERFGDTLVDAIAAVAETLIERSARRPEPSSSLQRTLQRAQAYINAQLGDPDLDPARVAAHCGVSTSYLHAAFAAHAPMPVAQLIRESRLQACREAFADPQLQQRSILQIAGDWGFDDASHFSRLYKARFGLTPREARRLGARRH